MEQGTWPALQAAALRYASSTGNYYSVHHGGPDGGASPSGASARRRLFIDNRDRTDPANTSPFDFAVSLSDRGLARYEMVSGVELKAIAMPKVAGEMYVAMDVDEMTDQLDSTSAGVHRTFALLYFDSDALTPGSVKPIKAYDFYQKEVRFNPSLAGLDRLHVRFRKRDGSVVTAADTAGNTTVSFLMEVMVPPSRF